MGRGRVGVDVGGTFTDVVLAADGRVLVAKVPSTPDDQAAGVIAGVERLRADPVTFARFAHGTTVATNTVLERDGGRTVLVATRGFADLLEIGRQDRPSLYDLWGDRPAPLAAGELVVQVAERLGADGTVVEPLTDDEARRCADAVRALAPDAVAVCLLFSFVDDRHERRIEDALAGAVPVSRSSDVLPVFREYERASTTVLNAYVAPRMGRYLVSLTDRLEAAGLTCPVEVMRSGGGTFTTDVAARYPVETLLSGPAAGAWGAAAVGRAVGEQRLIAFDMGGTSTDVTLIEDGIPSTTAEGEIDGLPFAVTTTDIHTVGSGGGSIAWRDPGGALRVGPRSAGAVPGPACYGRGGTSATVTDANVVLGRLGPAPRLGGDLPVDADLAWAAIERLAAELDLEPVTAADGILRVVEAQMAKALRVVSVERGHDPRGFTLVPFGGAGPLHQGALARDLGCRRVLIPRNPGVLSALGLLAAPVTADAVRTHLVATHDAAVTELEAVWSGLEEQLRRRFEEQDVEIVRLERSADLRYRGQAFELEVAAPAADPSSLAAAFEDTHRRRYGYAQDGEAIEVVNLRVRASGPQPDVPLPEIAAGRGASGAARGTHRVVIEGRERDCPVYDRDVLGAGDRVDGPAVITGIDSTCFLEPWQRADVDAIGNLVVDERRD